MRYTTYLQPIRFSHYTPRRPYSHKYPPPLYNSLYVSPTIAIPQSCCISSSDSFALILVILWLLPPPTTFVLTPKRDSAQIPGEPFSFSLVKRPNLNPTSDTVTMILSTIRIIMIQVIWLILVSAMDSERIVASSRNTEQRSLRTLMRGVISRYSRTAK